MAIRFDEEERVFTLDTVNTTYQMMVDDYGFLLHLYYGAKVYGSMKYLIRYKYRTFSGNPDETGMDRTCSLDVLLQEYPTWGTGDFRNTALIVQNGDGTECCKLKYVGHKIYAGKYGLSGLPAVYADESEAETLEIYMEDSVSKLNVTLLYGVLPDGDIITRSAVLKNEGEARVVIEKAGSCCLELLPDNYDLISFYGAHNQERNFQRMEIGHGSSVFGSRRGTSSHQYNPAFILADRAATEAHGTCYGMIFVYSGGFQFEAEKDSYGQVRAIMGIQPDQFHYSLNHGEAFVVPETILTFSNRGFSKLSHQFHWCINHHIVRGIYKNAVRPILINSWEAAYFDFDGEKILQLAKDSAELGIELVVMDDGWFGKRNDDNTSLGDWVVNEEKLGCSLGELIQKINALGVKFGIWMEPEMISEDSELYRNHPDWVLQIPGRKPVRARNQLVLDFSRKIVRDFIFDAVCAVLEQGNVSYIKWDMNRSLSDIYSPDRTAGKVLYDYMLGVYEFLERLRDRYPNILIEGCSGGGGRFDAGMMYYTPQIWCSDNTDAIDRTRIQYGTSFFYPVSVVGSHVSEVPNHQTGRMESLKTRGITAMAGTFGYELNPQKLSAEEREEIREQILTFKKYQKLIQTGRYYRLTDPFTDYVAAWLLVSEDQTQALLNVVKVKIHANMGGIFVKLKDLYSGWNYVDVETQTLYDADALMEAGFPVPFSLGEYEAYQVEFVSADRK